MADELVPESDVQVSPLHTALNDELLQTFRGERTGFVRAGPNGYILPASYAKDGHHLRNFKPRPTDTWVVTFPRSGTTWTQEMVWMIQSGFDYETAAKVSLNDRFPFLEFSFFLHPNLLDELLAEQEGNLQAQQALRNLHEPMYRIFADMPESTPRFIKTHLPFSLLPKDLLKCGAKVIYVARNPKDVAVSYYHLNRSYLTCGYTGDFRKYWHYFENDLQPWSPYWSHLSEGWANRNEKNMLFMFYEEMSSDTSAAISKVAEFLGKDLIPGQVSRLADHLNISNFRKNTSVNSEQLVEIGVMRRNAAGFVRNGQVGGWVSEFTPELSDRADHWIQRNLERTKIEFPIIAKNNLSRIHTSG